jgi:mono/diheme cytochrome c family protein
MKHPDSIGEPQEWIDVALGHRTRAEQIVGALGEQLGQSAFMKLVPDDELGQVRLKIMAQAVHAAVKTKMPPADLADGRLLIKETHGKKLHQIDWIVLLGGVARVILPPADHP